jgi:shikimate 5-dehydrogenase
MISGKTTLIAHLGYPTESIKAPMIYNPWFEKPHSARADYKSIGTINQGRARTISAHRDPDDTSDWTAVDFD